MPIREIRHPLIRHKIGLMRRADISTKNFRELAQEVGALLTYEATNDLPLEHYEIQGWAGPVQVEKIAGKLLPFFRDYGDEMKGYATALNITEGDVVSINLIYQLERLGYFWRDPVDSRPEALVMNRIVPLKEGYRV